MPEKPRQFFLQAIDPDHGCAVLEAMFHVDDIGDLHSLLDLDGVHDADLRGLYEISRSKLDAIKERFAVAFEPGNRKIHLAGWHSLRAIPYLVHTNYELMLLLYGRKKFARMMELYPPERHYSEEYFERYVTEGVLHREIAVEPFAKPIKTKDGQIFRGHRTVYYTLKGEEWRIAAWKMIFAASRKAGWNESFERLEGMLFGYEEWQVDWWIARLQERRETLRLEDGEL